jgi:hypothetical protein
MDETPDITVPTWLKDLFRCQRDEGRSTRATQIYTVASGSTRGRFYRVCCDIEAKGGPAWRCQCPGFTYRDKCRHIDLARNWAGVEWWTRTLAHFSTTNLLAMQETYLARIAAEEETEDDRHALAAITLILRPGLSTEIVA